MFCILEDKLKELILLEHEETRIRHPFGTDKDAHVRFVEQELFCREELEKIADWLYNEYRLGWK